MIERQTTLPTEQAAAALRETEARLRRARTGLGQAERDAQRAAVLVARELIAPQEGEHARLRVEVEANAVEEVEEALVSSEKQLALARVGLQQIDIVRAERDALARQRDAALGRLHSAREHGAVHAVREPRVPGAPLRGFRYQVLFKGDGLAYVWPDVVGILALGVLLFAISIRRFARLAR